jgi:hypothetical protein
VVALVGGVTVDIARGGAGTPKCAPAAPGCTALACTSTADVVSGYETLCPGVNYWGFYMTRSSYDYSPCNYAGTGANCPSPLNSVKSCTDQSYWRQSALSGACFDIRCRVDIFVDACS